MPIKISQLPELVAPGNDLLTYFPIIDLTETDNNLKTKKISVQNLADHILTKEVPTLTNVYYVSLTGDDLNVGRTWSTALRTIEKALELTAEDDQITLIEVAPGIYEVEGHLDLPDNTIIKCAHRSVIIRPKAGFEERNVFRMGSGCFIEGFVFEDWRLDSLENPTEGFAVSFRPGAVITRVPYAHKIAVRTTPYWGYVAPPLDRENANPIVGRGAGVALADGTVCSPYSIFPNIMTWGATPVSHNGIGYCAKKGGLINAINAVSIWQHKHFLAIDGGQIILSSCSTQFGDYTMVSKGGRDIVVPEEVSITLSQQSAANAAIISAKNTIIDNLWQELSTTNDPDTGLPWNDGWTELDEEYTRRDAGNFLQCVAWVLRTANEKPMLDFAKGFFNTDVSATYAIDTDKLDAFIFSFEYMRDQISALIGVNGTSQTIVSALVDALSATLTNPTKRFEPSTITAIGHTWSSIFSGVALTKIPPAKNLAKIQDSILEIDSGVVIASGQDDQGSALFVGGLEINSDTGELGGPPFFSAVTRITNKTAIARSF